MAIVDGFSHLVIHVTDLERAVPFYRDVIGLDEIGRDLVNDEGPNVLLGMNTRQRVLLVEVPEVTAIRPNSSTIHHAWLLTMEEFERTRARMEKAGYDVEDSRAQFRAMGEHSMDIFDPDGHRFQIQAYAPESTAVLCDDTGPVNCGPMDKFPVGTVKTFVRGKFFLVRLEGGFLALSRWCTHLNGILAWRKEHWEFLCPMHGARFDRKGISRPLARQCRPLRMHPVTITEAGEIIVDPDTAIERERFSPDQLVPAEPGARLAAAAMEGA